MRETRVRADQVVRELEIERRQRQRLVVDDLDRGAAAAEHDHRTEGRIVGNAGDQLARLRPQDHRMDGDAGDARIAASAARARARMSVAASRTGCAASVRLSRTPPTSDLCTMSGDRILATTVDPPWPATGRPRLRPRRDRAPARRRDRNGIGARAARVISIGSSQVLPAASALRTTRAGGCEVGREIRRQARRRRHQGVLRLAVAHQMHEAADRVGFGRHKSRNAGALEDRRGRAAAADPDGEHRLRRYRSARCLRDDVDRRSARRRSPEASAVGTFMTSTASLSGSSSSASNAAA